jgi:TPR repeat protein
MYRDGRGVPQDDAEAMKWALRAAEQNDAFGQFLVGAMYAEGRGARKDRVQAYKYFNLVAAHADAGLAVGALAAGARKTRDQVDSMMTPEQIAKAQKLSREWKPKPER